MKHFIGLLLKRDTNLVPSIITQIFQSLSKRKAERHNGKETFWKQKSVAHPAAFKLHTCLLFSPTFYKAAYTQASPNTHTLCHLNNAKLNTANNTLNIKITQEYLAQLNTMTQPSIANASTRCSNSYYFWM